MFYRQYKINNSYLSRVLPDLFFASYDLKVIFTTKSHIIENNCLRLINKIYCLVKNIIFCFRTQLWHYPDYPYPYQILF